MKPILPTTPLTDAVLYLQNPIAVNHAYPRHRALQADLTRYYEDCIASKTAKRFKGQRRKSYCAGTWKRMYMAGRYKDYKKYKGKTHRAPMKHAAEYALANPVYDDAVYGKDTVPAVMLGVGAVSAIGIGLFLFWLSKRPPRSALAADGRP